MPPAQTVVSANQAVTGANQAAQATTSAVQAAQAVGTPGTDNAPKKSKTKVIAIVLCAVAVILCAAIIVLIFVYPGQKDTTPRAITVSFSAEGYDSSCTKIPVAIAGTDSTGASVETVGFIDELGSGIELAPGEYDLSFPASPLTPTGVLYNTPSSTAHVNISGKKDETGSITAFQDEPAAFTKSSGADETDEMINKAYEYAIMDESQKQKAEELKRVAENIHSQAVAAKNLAAARLIDMPLYTVQIPEYWVGKVDVVKSGNDVTVNLKGNSKAPLFSVSIQSNKNTDAGDIGNAMFKHVSVSSTQNAELWARNWAYYAWANLTQKYKPDVQLTESEFNTCIELQSGGAVTYWAIKSTAQSNPDYSANSDNLRAMADYIDNNIVLTAK